MINTSQISTRGENVFIVGNELGDRISSPG